MFVGNHTLYGILDSPFLFFELYRRCGIFLRSMGDHSHFRFPGWREFLTRYGVVAGTRANCAALLESGESVLVFPGGAREVAKRRGESYQLMWRARLGFARLAVRYGCTIVPFSAVGIDDAFKILYDADDIWASPVGQWLDRVGVRRGATMPIVSSVRPDRLYFQFSEPVSTYEYGGRYADEEVLRTVREQVRLRVQRGIESLRREREQDPQRGLLARFRRKVDEWFDD